MKKTARRPQKRAPMPRHILARNERNPSIPHLPSKTTYALTTSGRQFGKSVTNSDATKFIVQHNAAGDKAAYTILDSEKGTLEPLLFPVFKRKEPRLFLADAIGSKGPEFLKY